MPFDWLFTSFRLMWRNRALTSNLGKRSFSGLATGGAKRRLLVLLGLVLLVAVSPGTAWSSLFLTFSGTEAAPGDVVTVQTGGRWANMPASQKLRVFLARDDEAATITSPEDSRLIPLGRLTIDEEGYGYLRFRVPHVPADDYTTFVHCIPCASYSAGRELLRAGPHPGSFVVLDRREWSPLVPIMLGAGGAILLLGGIGWVLRRRSAHRPATSAP